MSFETPLPPYNASDPYATFLSSSLFDLLMIEMVPLAYRLAAMPPHARKARVRDRPPKWKVRKTEDDAKRQGKDEQATSEAATDDGGSARSKKPSFSEDEEAKNAREDEDDEESSSNDEMMAITGPGTDGMAGYAGTSGPEGEGEEAERERAYKRCEGWGYRVGQGAVER